MASKIKVDQLETADGTGTIALQNQLSGMTTASLPALGSAQMPTGSVLQVKHYQSSGAVTFPQNTGVTTSMYSGTITPSATSSKIYIIYYSDFGLNGGNYPAIQQRLTRGSTELDNQGLIGYMDNNNFDRRFQITRTYLDSPSSTSELTYTVYGGNGTGSGFSGTYNGAGNKTRPGTITLMEIAG